MRLREEGTEWQKQERGESSALAPCRGLRELPGMVSAWDL